MKLKFDRWVDIIIYLDKGKTKTEISKELDITYAHVCNVIKELGKLDMIEEEHIGRITQVSLTEKGQKNKKILRRVKNNVFGKR